MVELAKTERAVILPVSTIDTDPMLLGVENGVIDLRTGGFRPAEREDYVTKRCGVAFDPSATCPNWGVFLQQIFPNNQTLIAYVQRACGYTLTGLTDEEVMFILWATGANGKSTSVRPSLRSWATMRWEPTRACSLPKRNNKAVQPPMSRGCLGSGWSRSTRRRRAII